MSDETQQSPSSNPPKTKNSRKPSRGSAKSTEPSTSGKTSGRENEISFPNKFPKDDYRNRAAEALKRLGVELCNVAQLPPINKLLIEQSRNGISGAIEAMRMSDGEISQTFLEKWDSIPEHDRDYLTIEAVALAAGVDPRALLGEILLAAREYSVVKFKLRAVEAHPQILEKRIEFAQLVGGYRDRDAIDTILGALPRSKTTFIDKFYASSELPEGEEEGKDAEAKPAPPTEPVMVEDENFVFPECELMQEEIQPIRQKLLETKK